jgi:hypothetical protein
VRGEYLLWQIRRGGAPPLVTTTRGTPGPGNFGAIGQPGTVALFQGPLDYEERSGGRVTVGYFFDRCGEFGIEGSYFMLADRTLNFAASSVGDPLSAGGPVLLARPFFNVLANRQDVELVAAPGQANGNIAVSSRSELLGAELNGIINLDQCCCSRWDLLVGFRYLRLKEDIEISENVTSINPRNPDAGAAFFVQDRFDTRNQFYGGQVGLRKTWNWRRWDLDVTGKVALGETHEVVDINGTTIITPPGGMPVAFNGGLLAQPTNIGHFSRDRFSVVPEVGVNIGYKFTDHLRGFVGYNFLYWSNVARPGDQIDLRVNPSQLPHLMGSPPVPTPGTLVGPAFPTLQSIKDRDFWAQGVNFGLEFRY